MAMFINYYKSYLSMIENSIGSHARRNLYIDFDDTRSRDILRGGEESCAFFVSGILRLFNLSKATFANVLSLEKHLLDVGWYHIDKNTQQQSIPPGSIIIREKRSGDEKSDMFGNSRSANYHIGFYLGNEEAVSNYSDGFQDGKIIDKPLSPWRHHYLYHGERSIKSILSFPFSMNIQQFISQDIYHFLINKQLEIPFIGMTEKRLKQYEFNEQDLDWALGISEGLTMGRMCGVACIVMAYQYLTQNKDRCLKDTLVYKTRQHEHGRYRNKDVGWYHDGLLSIAREWGLQGERGLFADPTSNDLRKLVADCIDNHAILIISTSPGFQSSKRGGHLVVVRGYNYNGYAEELIINDPLDPKANEGYSGAPTAVKLTDILECWSGKWIRIKKE